MISMRTILLLLLAALSGWAQYPAPITPLQVIDTRTGQGIPCVGCQIFTYAAGTSTPQATYTDASLGTANTNPVLTNSQGYAVDVSTITGIWIGGLCYKFVLEDASTVTIWTQDNICAGGTNASAITQGVLGAANGGTGKSNTATLQLGSTDINLATLATGPICNTTTTGQLYGCVGYPDIVNTFTGCQAPVSTAVTTQGTATVLVANTSGLNVGMFVSTLAADIPAGDVIVSITANTSIVIGPQAATGSNSTTLSATSGQYLGGNGLCNDLPPANYNTPAGVLTGANMNSTGDQPITINIPPGFTRYAVRHIVVSSASISLTTAVGGIYTSPAKAGTQVVANTQVYSGLTSVNLFLDLTLGSTSVSPGNAYQNPILYFSLTTPQGAAATANVSVYVDFLP